MITNKQSFNDIEAMLTGAGWKLFQESVEHKAQAALSSALKGESDREVAQHMQKYKVLKELMQGVFGEYKNNYNKYKLGE